MAQNLDGAPDLAGPSGKMTQNPDGTREMRRLSGKMTQNPDGAGWGKHFFAIFALL